MSVRFELAAIATALLAILIPSDVLGAGLPHSDIETTHQLLSGASQFVSRHVRDESSTPSLANVLGEMNMTELMADDNTDKLEMVMDVFLGANSGGLITQNRTITSYNETFDMCTISANQSCSMSYLRENQSEGKQGWIVMPGNGTMCLDGSPFGFQVYPGNNQTEKSLFWFQGGGACYDYETCIKLSTALSSFSPESSGVFNYAEPSNPIGGNRWTTVVNNYCTGDAFMGTNKTQTFTDEPFSNKSAEVHFNGATNTLAVLDWFAAQPESKPSNKLAVGGCSAGSLGAQFWSKYLVENYNASNFVLDSYIGDFSAPTGGDLNVMGVCDTGANLMGWTPEYTAACANGSMHEMSDFFGPNLEAISPVPIAYVGSLNDIVQKSYYVITASNDDSIITPFLRALTEIQSTFTPYLLDTLGSYQTIGSQFSYYLVDSDQHCFLPQANFYDAADITANDAGNLTMLDFVNDFLNNDVYGSVSYPARK
ncbi:hypothetical protein SARC_03457 [Sphaeroforma arctica JP610]|uniref:Uncharacterized protein n=1 Tax=Sphaeroforma arctica JP610 TaxID=667725 RepID=A0A0L0G619_9EUKA|nr:hypothetical protein SARC_03457 [Sphaeroforma arctica JP610]KNC84296.1 hypothetical protein SARC_03457 [Sphaeroforma arctica JP610]|eukprot:XP_014158198.1 hypothetical protein SARC_03457 [Sphaeroforma arctica JP610]